MQEAINVILEIINSPIVQGAMAVASFSQIVSDAIEKRRKNSETLESQAVYCFDHALSQLCAYYKIEYDYEAIEETFLTNVGSMKQISTQGYQDTILEKAIGVDSISEEQRDKWYYYVDKTIAEEKLDILNNYLIRREARKREKGIPLLLTEKAPRPPVEEQLLSRTEEQREVLDTIQKKKKLVLVNGLGGVGKSTVCKELFYYLYDKKEQHLAWVIYNGKSLEEDFVSQFSYPDFKTERRKRLRFFLQNEIDDNAIIFVDNLNVRDIDDRFIEVLQKARCNVICTSRITDYAYFTTIPINFFLPQQCVTLFKKYAHIDTNENDQLIEQIVRKVGLHTLTIEVLGKIAYCEEQSPKEILKNLEQKGIDLEGSVEVQLEEDTLVGHLCRIFPVSKLDEQKKYILTHFARCPLEHIPKDIKSWLGISGKHNINYLIKYGWFVENENSYYMHPIIKNVVNRTCSIKQEQYITLLKSFEKIGRYDRNTGIEKTLMYYDYMKSVATRLDGFIHPSAAWLYFNCACIEKIQGHYNIAITSFKEAIGIWADSRMTSQCSPVYINTRLVNIHVQIGSCYNELGLTYEARHWYDKMFYFKKPYVDNELRAQIHNNYALTYQEDYRKMREKNTSKSSLNRLYYKAEKGFKQTIIEFQKLGKKDAFMGTAFRNLGVLYMDGGEIQKAINCFEKALRIRERVLDQKSSDKEKNYYDLAKAYFALAEEECSFKSKAVKYRRAYYYFGLCYEVCKSKVRKGTNSVDLEKIELEMKQCCEKCQIQEVV